MVNLIGRRLKESEFNALGTEYSLSVFATLSGFVPEVTAASGSP